MSNSFLLRASSVTTGERRRLLEQVQAKSPLLQKFELSKVGDYRLSFSGGQKVFEATLKEFTRLGWSVHTEIHQDRGIPAHTFIRVNRPDGSWPMQVTFFGNTRMTLVTAPYSVDNVVDLPSPSAYGESLVDKELLALANAILPKGRRDDFGWSERGNRGQPMIELIYKKLKQAGFKEVDHKNGGSPDGYTSSAGTHWQKGPFHAYTNSYYGVVARENSFSCNLSRDHQRGR